MRTAQTLRSTASRETVLVIEDDPGTRETLQYMLIAEGYDVRTASNVEDALAAVSRYVPDAMLLDLHLPGQDGLQCLRRLRATDPGVNVPVAILTADYFVDEDVARELKSLGAHIHFKPVWDSDLRRIVLDLLARSSCR
jgi:two-component system OmpR family response regulator